MAQLPDLPSPGSPPLDTVEGDPFYGADLPSLIACLEPLPHSGMPVSPNSTPPPLFQVSHLHWNGLCHQKRKHLLSRQDPLSHCVSLRLYCITCLALIMHLGDVQNSTPSYTAEHVEMAPPTANESLSRDEIKSHLHFNRLVCPHGIAKFEQPHL